MVAQHLFDALGQTGALGDDHETPPVADPVADMGDRAVGVASERLGVHGGERRAHVDVVVLDDQLHVSGEGRQCPPGPPGVDRVGAHVGERPVGGHAQE